MSYIKPGIDRGHIVQSAVNSKSLGYLSNIEDTARMRALQSKYTPETIKGMLERRYATPKQWSAFDNVLTQLGVQVDYKEGKRVLDTYKSNWINAKIAQKGLKIDESALIRGAKEVAQDCDLRGTTLKNLADLKKIGGSLTIDSFSNFDKDCFSNLEEIGRSLFVHLKNAGDMTDVLKNIGLDKSIVKGKIIPVIKNYI